MSHLYQFDEYLLDTHEETLYRNGEKVNINRRTFQVLRLLVECAGKVVTKQDFFEIIWANTFVEDNVLTVTMTALRKALGDDAKNAKFIENLPRKGYRFIGQVKIVDNVSSAQNVENTQVASAANIKKETIYKNRKILLGISAVCLLFLLFIVGFAYFRSHPLKNSSTKIESIAVLPFENQITDTQYLSDGLTEGIIKDLTALPNLRVINRNSVFQYQNKQIDLPTIGHELNVSTILTGKLIERDGNPIIEATLTDTSSNQKLWKREYKLQNADTDNVQQKISWDISETLRLKLTDEQHQRLAKIGTDNPEAYKLYLKGRYFWNKRTQEDLNKAVDFFNQSIEQDPTYAQAFTGLASAYILRTLDNLTVDERYALVQATAQKALDIDPNSGEAYAVLAISNCFLKWEFAAAEKQYRRAIELNPNYATARHWLAELLAIEGKFDESFAEYNRAIELDPLSLAIQIDVAMNYYYARQNDKAIEYLQKLKAINPNYSRIDGALVGVYEEKDMFPEAIKAWESCLILQGENPQEVAIKIKPLEEGFKKSGKEGYWRSKLQHEENVLIGGDFGFAIIYARLGEKDKALDALEKTFAEHNGAMPYLKLRPEFDNLHSEPRFIDLVRRVGIP